MKITKKEKSVLEKLLAEQDYRVPEPIENRMTLKEKIFCISAIWLGILVMIIAAGVALSPIPIAICLSIYFNNWSFMWLLTLLLISVPLFLTILTNNE